MGKAVLENVHIQSQELLPTPREIRELEPVGEQSAQTVLDARAALRRILRREDHRIFVVVGPCSIHDTDAALEYATRLKSLSDELSDTLLLVMRAYFEKPRTSIGWKGFINDPYLDDSFRVGEGLRMARALMVRINEIGIATGTEALDPITPQYLGDLVSWTAIGARTTESQTHREMASGLSSPVGFKNGTDGNVEVAVNALKAVRYPHAFLGVTLDGRCAVFRTGGNRDGHIILRGGARPNYDSVSVAICEQALQSAGLELNVVVDCSHGNSFKRHELQPRVLHDCVNQIRDGNASLVGFMLESNLEGGRQEIPADKRALRRGVSITDPCIDWDTTAQTLREARERLREILPARLARRPGAASR
jgi:3-deoxy-7-phosphoheptulonate synthase